MTLTMKETTGFLKGQDKMKLLFCRKCGDVFDLGYDMSSCTCGNARGYYKENGIHAVYSGEDVVPLGFNNTSFAFAILASENGEKGISPNRGVTFEAFIIPPNAPTMKKVDGVDINE